MIPLLYYLNGRETNVVILSGWSQVTQLVHEESGFESKFLITVLKLEKKTLILTSLSQLVVVGRNQHINDLFGSAILIKVGSGSEVHVGTSLVAQQ